MLRAIADFVPHGAEAGVGLALQDGEGRYLFFLAGTRHCCPPGEVFVHAGERDYPIRRTLSELEARLDPARFFRAHRSAIVNLDRVQEIIPWFKGTHRLRLTTGAEVDLSRRRARALRELLRW